MHHGLCFGLKRFHSYLLTQSSILVKYQKPEVVICFVQGIAVILVNFQFQRKEMWYLNEIQVMLFSLGYLVYGNL